MGKKLAAPSADDMHIAALWLEIYEGAEDADACHRVAEWLRRQSDAKVFKQTCREAGVSVKQARAALAAAGQR